MMNDSTTAGPALSRAATPVTTKTPVTKPNKIIDERMFTGSRRNQVSQRLFHEIGTI